MNRREFGKIGAVAAIASLIGMEKAVGQQQQQTCAPLPITQPAVDEKMMREHQVYMDKYKDLVDGKKLNIALLAYPGMFLQDLIGPLTVFEALMNRDIQIVWKDKNPVSAGSIVPLTPTTTFAECSQNLDVLFVPGGVPGTFNLMQDNETLDFLREQSKTAKYITSVCTGSLILAAAGLLKGYRATSHWATRDALKDFGAIPTNRRIVQDRNRITGGGVTAGLDFGLTLAAKLRNPIYAQAVQLYLEYAPAPPFNAGTPATASAKVNEFMGGMMANLGKKARAIAKEINQN